MHIKINEKVFCFPPYISTSWDNIKFLHVDTDAETKKELLAVTLNDGYIVKIPNLDTKIIQLIFSAHLKHLEQKTDGETAHMGTNISFVSGDGAQTMLGVPFRFNEILENLGSALQHNASQSNSPTLPIEVLNKLASFAKIVGAENATLLPKPEPHCNCLHCQIARAIQNGDTKNDHEMLDEEVSDEDLKFRLWDIQQSGEKLYIVRNPLDNQEQYSVYLGDPIGCTCGQKNCEHIRSVLNS